MQGIAEQQPEQFFVSSPRLFIVPGAFMPPAKKKDLPWPFLGAILTVTVVIVLAIIGAVHTIDGEIASKFGSLDNRSTALETQIRNSDIPGNFAKLNEKTGKSETEISKLRDAIEVLKNKQNKNTQKLIEDLLAAAGKVDSDTASKLLGTAKSLISVLRVEKQASDPQYFKTTVASLQELSKRDELATSVLSARLALAGYRSSQETAKAVTVPPRENGIVLNGPGEGVERMTVNGGHLTGSIIQLGPSLKGDLSDQVWVKDVTLVGGFQTLDGIIWENTTFVGMHIRYSNGETSLKGVHFVDCIFDFTPGPRAAQLADVIALNPSIPTMATSTTPTTHS